MNTKSNMFFEIMNILMIIGGVVGIISGVIAVLGAGVLAETMGDSASFGLLMFAAILMWASGTTGLITGITGARKAVKPEKVMVCIVFGSLTVVLTALGNILSVAGGGSLNVVGLIIGLVLPVLYLFSVFQSKGGA